MPYLPKYYKLVKGHQHTVLSDFEHVTSNLCSLSSNSVQVGRVAIVEKRNLNDL